MAILCPLHGGKLRVSQGWKAPEGYDPKMIRSACLDCTEHWYKAPKKCHKRWSEVQAEMELVEV